MIKRLFLILIIISMLMPAGIALADTSTALYRSTITISNNSTATTNEVAVFTGNTSAWMDVGYINSSANNTFMQSAAGANVTYMPGYGGLYPWCVWVPAIGEKTYINDYLYMGGPDDMEGKIRYFPDPSGNMTTPYDASLILSDNFTFEAAGYIDTTAGAGKFIVGITSALGVYVSPTVSGNITASILNSDDLLYVKASSQYCNKAAAVVAPAAGNTITLEGWFYLNSNTGTSQTIVGAGHSAGAAMWYLGVNNANKIVFYVGDTPATGHAAVWTQTGTVSLETWHYVTATYDNLAAPKTVVYVDGDEVAGVDTGVGGTINQPNAHLSVGASWADPYTSFLDGYIDEVRVSDSARTLVNHQTAWSGGTIGVPFTADGNAISLWHFNEGAGNPADTIGNNDLTRVNNPTWSTISPLPSTSVSVSALGVESGEHTLQISIDSGINIGAEAVDGDSSFSLNYTHLDLNNPANANGTIEEINVWAVADITGFRFGSFYLVSGTTYKCRDSETIAGTITAGAVRNYDGLSLTIEEGDYIGCYFTGGQIERTTSGYDGVYYVSGEYIDPGDQVSYTLASGDAISLNGFYAGLLSIFIDSVSDNVSMGGDSVTDNGNDFVSFQNGVMPYVEYQEITVGGELRQYVEWEYGLTFHDTTSGYNNDATPTFRTTSSDADVSAEMVSFAPISTARAPAYSVADAPFFYTGNITASGNFTVGAVPAGGPPGSGVIDEAAAAGGTPNIWLWGLIAIFTIALSGLFISYMEKKFGSGGGTLMIRVIVATIIMGLLVTFGKFDWWMLIIYFIIVAAIIMWSQHREWGGNVSQHGLIGFLAMSWVGLTLINRIMESQLLTVYERSWANNFAFTQEFKAFDVFSIPVLNFSFFTQGIPSLMRWDYSFFGGNAQLFQYLLYSLTAVVSFIIFGILIGLLFNAFRAR